MGDEAVQPQGDAQYRDPIQNREGHHRLPAPKAGQEGKHRAHMHGEHERGGAEFELALTGRQRGSVLLDGIPHAGLLGCVGPIDPQQLGL